MNTLQQKIESLLFYRNEPVSLVWLSKHLGIRVPEVKSEIENMMSFYENRGITIVSTDDKVSLLTSESSRSLISSIAKDTEERELSRQALETLSIILYKKSIIKSELDYIRGVNSVFILRNLLIRGLVEKKTNPSDKRSYLYSITHDALSFLGVRRAEDLPEFNKYSQRLKDLEKEWSADQELGREETLSDGNNNEL